jgi:hypothetical protein
VYVICVCVSVCLCLCLCVCVCVCVCVFVSDAVTCGTLLVDGGITDTKSLELVTGRQSRTETRGITSTLRPLDGCVVKSRLVGFLSTGAPHTNTHAHTRAHLPLHKSTSPYCIVFHHLIVAVNRSFFRYCQPTKSEHTGSPDTSPTTSLCGLAVGATIWPSLRTWLESVTRCLTTSARSQHVPSSVSIRAGKSSPT